MKFDELNQLRDYFSVMNISEEDKEERVILARKFYYVYQYILALMYTDSLLNETLDRDFYIGALEGRLRDVFEELGLEIDEEYIQHTSEEIIDTTIEHYSEEEYFDDERALDIAENESSNVINKRNFKKAKKEGKQFKQWVTENDDAVRLEHRLVEGEVKKIDEYFIVGGELMLYPRDPNGSAWNTIRCRCDCRYF